MDLLGFPWLAMASASCSRDRRCNPFPLCWGRSWSPRSIVQLTRTLALRWSWRGVLVAVLWGSGGALATRAEAVLPDRCSTLFRPLIQDLLPTLPSYANRAIIRARSSSNASPQTPSPGLALIPSAPANSQPHHVITVGKPDFRPLPLDPLAQQFPDLQLNAVANRPELQQVFLTSLERRLTPQGIESQQLAHWLFFQPVNAHWQLVKVVTLPGGYPDPTRPTPQPWEDTDGILAEAVRTQLRDCQAADP